MAARIKLLLTVADLDACPDDSNRYELIEGELFVSALLLISRNATAAIMLLPPKRAPTWK